MGKLTISMAIFNNKLLNYQRVDVPILGHRTVSPTVRTVRRLCMALRSGAIALLWLWATSSLVSSGEQGNDIVI